MKTKKKNLIHIVLALVFCLGVFEVNSVNVWAQSIALMDVFNKVDDNDNNENNETTLADCEKSIIQEGGYEEENKDQGTEETENEGSPTGDMSGGTNIDEENKEDNDNTEGEGDFKNKNTETSTPTNETYSEEYNACKDEDDDTIDDCVQKNKQKEKTPTITQIKGYSSIEERAYVEGGEKFDYCEPFTVTVNGTYNYVEEHPDCSDPPSDLDPADCGDDEPKSDSIDPRTKTLYGKNVKNISLTYSVTGKNDDESKAKSEAETNADNKLEEIVSQLTSSSTNGVGAYVGARFTQYGDTLIGTETSYATSSSAGGSHLYHETIAAAYENKQDCYKALNIDIALSIEDFLYEESDEWDTDGSLKYNCFSYNPNILDVAQEKLAYDADFDLSASAMGSYRARVNLMKHNTYFSRQDNTEGYYWEITNAYQKAVEKATTGEGAVITKEEIAPAKVKFVEHIIFIEATKKYADDVVYLDNISLDSYIYNKTNSSARFGQKPMFLPTANTGANEISQIRGVLARETYNGINLVPYQGGYRFVTGDTANHSEQNLNFKVEKESGIKLNSKDDYGINAVTGRIFIDKYYQRFFQIRNYKGLYMQFETKPFATSSLNDTDINVGDEVYLAEGQADEDATCRMSYKPLIMAYSGNENDTIRSVSNLDVATIGSGEYIYTLFDTVVAKKRDIDSGAIPLTIYSAVNRAFGESEYDNNINNAFQDIIDAQNNLNKGVSSSDDYINAPGYLTMNDGYGRGTILLGSADFAINFMDGKVKVSYDKFPADFTMARALKGTKSNEQSYVGDIPGKAYTTQQVGIYIKPQELLKEGYVDTLEMRGDTSTWSKTTTTTYYWEQWICIGEYHCTCADINVLCDCQDEEMGCTPVDKECEDNPELCASDYDCTENPSAPECQCFDDTDDTHKPCSGNGQTEYKNDLKNPWKKRRPLGGRTGKGNQYYTDKFFDATSSITN